MNCVAIDTNILKAFVDFDTPEVQQEVTLLSARETTILLAAPVLTEILVQDSKFIEDSRVGEDPRFRVAPLDLIACNLAAKITRDIRSAPIYRNTQRMTVNIQIVAIAAANNCYMIYSNCAEIRSIVRLGGLNIAVCSESDLPVFDPNEYS